LRRLLQRGQNPVERAHRSISDRRLGPARRLLRASNRRRQQSGKNETEKRPSENIPHVQHGAPIVYWCFANPILVEVGGGSRVVETDLSVQFDAATKLSEN